MAAPNDFMRGTDVALRFFTQGNKEVALNHVDFDISESADEGEDDVCGEDRSRPYCVTKLFEVGFNGNLRDTAIVDEYLANIANKDAGFGENPAVVSWKTTTKKGIRVEYVFTDIVRRPIAFNQSNRTTASKFKSGFRCRYLKVTKAV
jgi:hypothetical protein